MRFKALHLRPTLKTIRYYLGDEDKKTLYFVMLKVSFAVIIKYQLTISVNCLVDTE